MVDGIVKLTGGLTENWWIHQTLSAFSARNPWILLTRWFTAVINDHRIYHSLSTVVGMHLLVIKSCCGVCSRSWYIERTKGWNLGSVKRVQWRSLQTEIGSKLHTDLGSSTAVCSPGQFETPKRFPCWAIMVCHGRDIDTGVTTIQYGQGYSWRCRNIEEP